MEKIIKIGLKNFSTKDQKSILTNTPNKKKQFKYNIKQ